MPKKNFLLLEDGQQLWLKYVGAFINKYKNVLQQVGFKFYVFKTIQLESSYRSHLHFHLWCRYNQKIIMNGQKMCQFAMTLYLGVTLSNIAHHLLNKNYKWHTTWIQQLPALKWHTTHFKGLCTAIYICTCWDTALQDVALPCRMINARSFKGFKSLYLQIYPEVKGMWSHRMSEITCPHNYPTCQKLLQNYPTVC